MKRLERIAVFLVLILIASGLTAQQASSPDALAPDFQVERDPITGIHSGLIMGRIQDSLGSLDFQRHLFGNLARIVTDLTARQIGSSAQIHLRLDRPSLVEVSLQARSGSFFRKKTEGSSTKASVVFENLPVGETYVIRVNLFDRSGFNDLGELEYAADVDKTIEMVSNERTLAALTLATGRVDSTSVTFALKAEGQNVRIKLRCNLRDSSRAVSRLQPLSEMVIEVGESHEYVCGGHSGDKLGLEIAAATVENSGFPVTLVGHEKVREGATVMAVPSLLRSGFVKEEKLGYELSFNREITKADVSIAWGGGVFVPRKQDLSINGKKLLWEPGDEGLDLLRAMLAEQKEPSACDAIFGVLFNNESLRVNVQIDREKIGRRLFARKLTKERLGEIVGGAVTLAGGPQYVHLAELLFGVAKN